MDDKNINELIKGFNRVKSLGFVKSIANYKNVNSNDGAVGETFQYFFYGEGRDNRTEADWNGWEFKASRESTSSMRSLMTLKPSYPNNGDTIMREKWGRENKDWPGVKFLMPTIPSEINKYTKVHINTNKINPLQPVYLMRINNERENQKIVLIVKDINGDLIDDSIYWSYEDLRERWDKKLTNTIFLNAVVEDKDNIEYFFYKNAEIMIGSKFEDFLRCIDNGLITYDPGHDVYKSGAHKGKPHNHGGAFRFKKNKSILELSSNVISI